MTSSSERFTVGIDFGTLSGREVAVRVSDGAEVGSGVREYPHGVMAGHLTSAPRVPRAPAGLGAAGAVRPRGVLRHAVPAAIRDAGVEDADLAEMARTGPVVIDESTTVADFQRELRWDKAHYRLAQGF